MCRALARVRDSKVLDVHGATVLLGARDGPAASSRQPPPDGGRDGHGDGTSRGRRGVPAGAGAVGPHELRRRDFLARYRGLTLRAYRQDFLRSCAGAPNGSSPRWRRSGRTWSCNCAGWSPAASPASRHHRPAPRQQLGTSLDHGQGTQARPDPVARLGPTGGPRGHRRPGCWPDPAQPSCGTDDLCVGSRAAPLADLGDRLKALDQPT